MRKPIQDLCLEDIVPLQHHPLDPIDPPYPSSPPHTLTAKREHVTALRAAIVVIYLPSVYHRQSSKYSNTAPMSITTFSFHGLMIPI